MRLRAALAHTWLLWKRKTNKQEKSRKPHLLLPKCVQGASPYHSLEEADIVLI